MKRIISVIIPVYNVEKYLKRCLDSVVNQTYKNIEIILVNDGSTDQSEKICQEYEAKYDNIIYLSKPNGGLSDARNFGIKHSKGDYIAFVDSDDFIDLRMYQCLAEDIIKYDADIATCSYQEFSNEFLIEKPFLNPIVEVYERKESIKQLLLADTYCNYAWNKLYKRNLFDNILYPVGKKMEDLGTTYRLFEKSTKVTFRPFKAYYYFQRENSIIHTADHQFYVDKFFLSLERFRFLKDRYPDLEENYLFMLQTIFLDFKYYSFEKKMVQEVHHIVKYEVPSSMTKRLSRTQKIKYIILKFIPHIYTYIFGER